MNNINNGFSIHINWLVAFLIIEFFICLFIGYRGAYVSKIRRVVRFTFDERRIERFSAILSVLGMLLLCFGYMEQIFEYCEHTRAGQLEGIYAAFWESIMIMSAIVMVNAVVCYYLITFVSALRYRSLKKAEKAERAFYIKQSHKMNY